MGWMRTLAICAAALAALTVSSSAQNTGSGDGRRVALVIGNAAYGDMGVLINPVRDAKAVSESLKKAGFATVIEAEELDYEKFQRNLREFRRVADGASIAVIYYAGHGMEVNGQNWLVPLAARIDTPDSLNLEAISVDLLLRTLSGAKVKVLILDACRNNPFARSMRVGGVTRSSTGGGGLAPVNDAALSDDLSNGLFIMYAAAPGTTADDGLPTDSNSPFARALIEKLPVRGVDLSFTARGVRDLTLRYTNQRQRPFSTDSLGETPVYIAGLGDAPPTPTAGAATPPAAEAARIYVRAQAAAAAGDCQALKDFMGVFPVDTTGGGAKRDYETCIGNYLNTLVSPDRRSLTDADYAAAAAEYGVEVAALKAITTVESGRMGSWAADGRPNILFEKRIFSRRTNGRYDATNPNVSDPRGGGYPVRQADRWAQLREAYALDPENAVASASWGRFQILGQHYNAAGYGSATEFVSALAKSEVLQLQAFMRWARSNELIDEIQRLDFDGFAARYNGPTYQQFGYADKMRAAYLAAGGNASRVQAPPPRASPPPAPPTVDMRPALPTLRPAPATTAAVPLDHALTVDDFKGFTTVMSSPDVVAALNRHMAAYGVNTPRRTAHFLTQAYRSGALVSLDSEEDEGKGMETRADLGNTRPGDGVKYRPRGILRIYGRNAYRDYGAALGVDLDTHPELAATPDVATRIALLYWTRGYPGDTPLNTLADRDDVDSITKAVLGEGVYLRSHQGALQAVKRALKIPYSGIEIPNTGAPAAPWRLWLFALAFLGAGAALTRRRA